MALLADGLSVTPRTADFPACAAPRPTNADAAPPDDTPGVPPQGTGYPSVEAEVPAQAALLRRDQGRLDLAVAPPDDTSGEHP